MISFGTKALIQYGLTEEQAKEIKDSHYEEVKKIVVREKINQKHQNYKNAIINILPCLTTMESLRAVLTAAQDAFRREQEAISRDPSEDKQNEDKN